MFDAGVSAGPVSRPPKGAWEQWFAWHPVKIKGRIVWCKTIYRRRVRRYGGDTEQWSIWEYSTLFDILQDTK